MNKVKRAIARLVALTCTVLVASAHIGSPDVWFEGKAGPYPVVVNVQVPGVVPGIAQVYVRVTGDGIQQVSASGNKFDATAGSPPPEIASPVDGDPGLYHVPLWIMTPGSNSVTVFVHGAHGDGKVLVPAVIVANQRLLFSRPMAIGLGAIGILLFLGAISILGAVTRESTLVPGATADRSHRRRARLVMMTSAIVLAVLLFGGWRWWNAEDQRFAATLFKPMHANATLRTDNGVTSLDFSIADSTWMFRHDTTWFKRNANSLVAYRNASALTPLVPDHGKLMHLFLIREPDMTVFAHLHPTTTDSVTFHTPVPVLPAGHYRVYADIVLESGDAETMMTTVDVPAGGTAPASAQATSAVDPDNSWVETPASATDSVALAGGNVMHWDRSTPLVVGHPAPLTFVVTDRTGHAVPLAPYMGMAAHAVILRDDGTVFVHIHPTGTVSMGAEEAFALRRATDTVAGMVARRMQSDAAMSGMAGMAMPMAVLGDTVKFPYAFPKPGHYHIWVQVKQGSQILTGAFETQVGK